MTKNHFGLLIADGVIGERVNLIEVLIYKLLYNKKYTSIS